jgi:hypothetical protein
MIEISKHLLSLAKKSPSPSRGRGIDLIFHRSGKQTLMGIVSDFACLPCTILGSGQAGRCFEFRIFKIR